MMGTRSPDWGSDVTPSSPVAPKLQRHISFGGFCFTEGGIALDITDIEVEEFRQPPYSPYNSLEAS